VTKKLTSCFILVFLMAVFLMVNTAMATNETVQTIQCTKYSEPSEPFNPAENSASNFVLSPTSNNAEMVATASIQLIEDNTIQIVTNLINGTSTPVIAENRTEQTTVACSKLLAAHWRFPSHRAVCDENYMMISRMKSVSDQMAGSTNMFLPTTTEKNLSVANGTQMAATMKATTLKLPQDVAVAGNCDPRKIRAPDVNETKGNCTFITFINVNITITGSHFC
jgi:hypothetical protein